MKKYQIYASLMIFSFLMGVRLFMPELAESIRVYAFAVVDIEEKYKSFMEVLGDKLNDEELRDELVAVLGFNQGQEKEICEDLDETNSADEGQLPDVTASPDREMTS